MKKVLLLIGISAFWAGEIFAQQVSQKTQFYNNKFTLNPAVAGSEEKTVPLYFSVRRQWIGISEAPSTQTLSVNGYVGHRFGTGLVIYNDVAGPSRNTGLSLALSNHIELASDMWLSFGSSLNLYQYRFDPEKLQTDVPDDPAVTRLLAEGSKMFPDLTSGLYVTGRGWFAGLSVANMFQNDQDIFSLEASPNSLERLYYLMAGYKMGDRFEYFALEPNFLLKGTETGLFQLDVVLKAYYQDQWIGVSYRTGDALSFILGLQFDQFIFGYSYDFTLTDVSAYSSGTHEVTVGINLPEPIARGGGQSRKYYQRKKKARRPKRK